MSVGVGKYNHAFMLRAGMNDQASSIVVSHVCVVCLALFTRYDMQRRV